MFPATTHASKDTPKEERRRFPAVTKASRDTQGGRKEREKERKKERGRERERRDKRKRLVFPATNKRSGTHQRKRGVILSVAFRKTPGSKERKGEGKGEKGAKVPTGSNEPQKYFDRCGHLVPCRSGWLLRPLRSRKGMSQLGIPKMRQTSHFLWRKPSAVRSGHLHLQSKGDNDVPPFNGSTGGTLRAHPGLARGQTHLG